MNDEDQESEEGNRGMQRRVKLTHRELEYGGRKIGVGERDSQRVGVWREIERRWRERLTERREIERR